MNDFFAEGWTIVRHSILMLRNNFTDALRISVGPMLIGLAVVGALLLVSGGSLIQLAGVATGGATDVSLGGVVVFGLLFAMLVVLFVMSWIAVAWHRFVLREDYPQLLPTMQDRPILLYLGKSIQISLVLALIFMPISAIVSLITLGMFFLPKIVTAVLATFVTGTVFSYLWMRLAYLLPAVSIGEKMGMMDAWRATAGKSGAILAASVIFMLINSVLQAITLMLGDIPVLGLVLELALTWWLMFVGLGLLTTLYGIIAERRSL